MAVYMARPRPIPCQIIKHRPRALTPVEVKARLLMLHGTRSPERRPDDGDPVPADVQAGPRGLAPAGAVQP